MRLRFVFLVSTLLVCLFSIFQSPVRADTPIAGAGCRSDQIQVFNNGGNMLSPDTQYGCCNKGPTPLKVTFTNTNSNICSMEGARNSLGLILSDQDFSTALGNGNVLYATECPGSVADYVPTNGYCYKTKYKPDCGSYPTFATKGGDCCVSLSSTCSLIQIVDKTCDQVKAISGCAPTKLGCDSAYDPDPNVTPPLCKLVVSRIPAVVGTFKGVDFQGTCGEGYVDSAIGCIPVGDLTQTLSFAMKWIFLAAGGIIVFMVIRTGYILLTSAGDAEKLKQAREDIIGIISGIVLIIFALTILKVVGADIFGLPGFL